VHIHVEAAVFKRPVVHDTLLEVRLRLETCDACSRLAGGYYEAIIQLRGTNRTPTEEELQQYTEIIQTLLERINKKGDRLAFINKIAKLKEGVDFYLGSNKAAKHICQKITTEHAATLTESPSLVGRKDGVDVYRMTYALRLPQFKEGDILNYDASYLQVVRIGTHINVIDLVKGTTVTIDKKRIKNARKIAETKDAKTAIIVNSDKTTIQILDPDTYKTVTLKKPPLLRDERELKIIKIDNEILILK
jgi:nonsense-mediated mRNA decay protein 3